MCWILAGLLVSVWLWWRRLWTASSSALRCRPRHRGRGTPYCQRTLAGTAPCCSWRRFIGWDVHSSAHSVCRRRRGCAGGRWDRWFHLRIRFQRLTFWRSWSWQTSVSVFGAAGCFCLLSSRVSCGVDCSWEARNFWGIPARSRQETPLNPGNNDGFSVCLLAFPGNYQQLEWSLT